MEWLYGALGGALFGVAFWRLSESTREAAEHAAGLKIKVLEARIRQIEADLADLKRQK